MKKNETGEQPDETSLVWKLAEKPTAEAVASLVETEVITPKEARKILFREENKGDEVEALKEMVSTLQEMVKDLLNRQPTHITKVIEVPVRQVPYWNKVFLTGGGTYGGVINTSSTSAGSGNVTYTMSTNGNSIN